MSENITVTGSIGNQLPDNIFMILAILIIIIGSIVIIGALVWIIKNGFFKRLSRRLRRFFKSDSVTFLLQNNSCSHVVGKFIEEDLQKATSVIIIWQNGDNDIYAVTDDNLDDARAAGMMLSMANKVSSDNGN